MALGLTGEQFRDRGRLSASLSGSASPATSTGSGAAAMFGSSPGAPHQAPPASRPLGSSRLSVRLIDYEVCALPLVRLHLFVSNTPSCFAKWLPICFGSRWWYHGRLWTPGRFLEQCISLDSKPVDLTCLLLKLTHALSACVQYAGPNPVAFDIANHWCEWAADYHTDTPHLLDYTLMPNAQEQVGARLLHARPRAHNRHIDI